MPSAPGAAGGSNPAQPGTSATTTKTGRNTKGRSTKSATVAPPVEPKPPENPETGEVARAVKADLATVPAKLAKSALAMSCLALAREIDNPQNSATSKSMCARSLLETWDRLLELAPPEADDDELDDLAARRDARRARSAAAANL
jgi:hypothetical protein